MQISHGGRGLQSSPLQPSYHLPHWSNSLPSFTRHLSYTLTHTHIHLKCITTHWHFSQHIQADLSNQHLIPDHLQTSLSSPIHCENLTEMFSSFFSQNKLLYSNQWGFDLPELITKWTFNRYGLDWSLCGWKVYNASSFCRTCMLPLTLSLF